MLKAGAIIGTIVCGFNLLLAALILILITIFKKNPPILYIVFGESGGANLDVKTLATIKCLAILFNACAAGMSLVSLFVIWCALIKGEHWAFWALLLSSGLTQVMAFVADSAIGTKTLIPNLVLSLLFVISTALCGYAIFRQ
jgi:hypothetical protein